MASSDEDLVRPAKRRQAKIVLDDDYDNEEVEQKTDINAIPQLGVEKPHAENIIETSSKRIPPQSEMSSNTHRDTTSGLGNDDDNGSIKSLKEEKKEEESKLNNLSNTTKASTLSALIMPQSMDQVMMFGFEGGDDKAKQGGQKGKKQEDKKVANDKSKQGSMQANSSSLAQKFSAPKQSMNGKKTESVIKQDAKPQTKQRSPIKKVMAEESEEDSSFSESGSESGSGSSSGSSSSGSSGSSSSGSSSSSQESQNRRKEKIKSKQQLIAIRNKLLQQKKNKEMTVEEKVEYLKGLKNRDIKQKVKKERPVQEKKESKKKVKSSKKKMQTTQLTDEDVNFNIKEHLVEEFATRWWYAMPKWPPVNYDYTEKLRANKLRRVEIQKWKLEVEEDEQGNKKVFELEFFPGVFKDSQGTSHDMRPFETCPSLNNFMRFERGKLQQLLMEAYENQLNVLENLKQPYDRSYENEMKKSIKRKINKLSLIYKK